jgi:hypothetical protein
LEITYGLDPHELEEPTHLSLKGWNYEASNTGSSITDSQLRMLAEGMEAGIDSSSSTRLTTMNSLGRFSIDLEQA